MGNFVNFIREEKEVERVGNPEMVSRGFITMYNRLSNRVYAYVKKEVIRNEFGRLIGYLYISNMNGIRMNYKDGNLHSISYWNEYGDRKMPDTTTVLRDYKKVTRAGLVDMYSEITETLGMRVKRLKHGYKYNGSTYSDLDYLIMDSYFNKKVKIVDLIKDLQEYDYGYEDVREPLINYAKYRNVFIDFDKIYREEQASESSAKVEKEVNAPVVVEEVPVSKVTGGLDIGGENTEVFANVVEEKEENKYDKFADAALVEQITADPLPVFRQLNSYVLMTAKRINNAVLITGQGGVGKSYNVNRILSTFGTEGKDYVIMKGASSTAAMYQFLYDNYNKIVVFDDCDSVLVDDDAINILKGALDTGKTRKISYNKAKSNIVNTFDCKDHDECEARLAQWSKNNHGKPCMPNTFEFKGGIIFISNMDAERMSQGKAAALLGRCTQVDIKLLAEEVILRMESCLPHIKVYDMDGVDITDETIKDEVFKWISSDEFLHDERIEGKAISFRLFNKAYMFRYANLPMWKELSFSI